MAQAFAPAMTDTVGMILRPPCGRLAMVTVAGVALHDIAEFGREYGRFTAEGLEEHSLTLGQRAAVLSHTNVIPYWA